MLLIKLIEMKILVNNIKNLCMNLETLQAVQKLNMIMKLIKI